MKNVVYVNKVDLLSVNTFLKNCRSFCYIKFTFAKPGFHERCCPILQIPLLPWINGSLLFIVLLLGFVPLCEA